jgi:hypothetical protein
MYGESIQISVPVAALPEILPLNYTGWNSSPHVKNAKNSQEKGMIRLAEGQVTHPFFASFAAWRDTCLFSQTD